MTINGQSEDLNGGTLNNDKYQFTPGGLDINRTDNSTTGNWDNYTTGLFTFNIAASGANSITVESLTMTLGSTTANTAFKLGTASGSANFGNNPGLNSTTLTGTSSLTTPFEIAAGDNHTFLVWVNTAAFNSTHTDLSFTVNGIPEPSAALLGGLGLLVLLRRRR